MKQPDDKSNEDAEKPQGPKTNVKGGITQPEKFENKLNRDQLVDRFIESLNLFKETDDLAKKDLERKEKIRKQLIELQSGELRTYESYLTDTPQPYLAIFTKDSEYFKEIYRVGAIENYDPRDYIKPAIVGVVLNETIYHRFSREVVPVLRSRAIKNGIRTHKFHQYFDAAGRDEIIKFRNDTIDLLRKFQPGQLYEFRIAYATKYNVPGLQFRLNYY